MATSLEQKLDDGAMEDTRLYLKDKGHLAGATFINHDAAGPMAGVQAHDSYLVWVVSHGLSDVPALGGHTQPLPQGARPNCDKTMTPAVLADKLATFFPADRPGRVKLCCCHGTTDHQGAKFAQRLAEQLAAKHYYDVYVGGVWLAVKRPVINRGKRERVYDNSTNRFALNPLKGNLSNVRVVKERISENKLSYIHVRREYFYSHQANPGEAFTHSDKRLYMMTVEEKEQLRLMRKKFPNHPDIAIWDKWKAGKNPKSRMHNPKKFVYYPFDYVEM